jgi:hypothetical protein
LAIGGFGIVSRIKRASPLFLSPGAGQISVHVPLYANPAAGIFK